MSKPVIIGEIRGDYYLSYPGLTVQWITVVLAPLVYGLFFWWLWPGFCQRFLPDIPVAYSRLGLWEIYKTLLLALLCGGFVRVCVCGFSRTITNKLTGDEITTELLKK